MPMKPLLRPPDSVATRPPRAPRVRVAELRNLVVVLGDQLDLDAAAFDDFDAAHDAVWMAEVTEESTHVWSSKPRTVMFLAGMRHFAQALRAAGRPLHYTPAGRPRQPRQPAGAAAERHRAPAPGPAGDDGAGRLAGAAGDQGRGTGSGVAAGPPRRSPLLLQRARVRCARAGPQVAAHGVLLPRDAQAPWRADGRRSGRRTRRRPVELRRRQPRSLWRHRAGRGACARNVSSPMP